MRKMILIMCEATSISHVARPLLYAKKHNLDKEHQLIVATHPRFNEATHGIIEERYPRIDLNSVDPKTFSLRVRAGLPLFSYSTLQRYADQDNRIIESLHPDVIIGDLRWSLGVSAHWATAPPKPIYKNITNSYWDENTPTTRKHPMWWRIRPLRSAIARMHCGPINRLRTHYGLSATARTFADLHQNYADEIINADEANLPWSMTAHAAPATSDVVICLGTSHAGRTPVRRILKDIRKYAPNCATVHIATCGDDEKYKKLIYHLHQQKHYIIKTSNWVDIRKTLENHSPKLAILNGGSPTNTLLNSLNDVTTRVIQYCTNIDQQLAREL
jgi:hypothetical protein